MLRSRILIAAALPAAGGWVTTWSTGIACRQTINSWIRGGEAFDAVVDFEMAVRDPEHPDQFVPVYDRGDHLHPNDAGYHAMADAIDLAIFQQQ